MKVTDEELLKEVERRLTYDPASGVFFWRTDGLKHVAGDVAGHSDGRGYLSITLLQKRYKLHRIAWMMVYRRMVRGGLDHINGDRLDNRITNLREASQAQNVWNRIKNGGKYAQGVGKRTRGRFIARIQVPGGKKINLGRFDTEAEAHAAYLGASRILHGEFSAADRLQAGHTAK